MNDVCVQALAEAGAFTQGQTPSAADLAAALTRLQNIFHNWSNDRNLVYLTKTVGLTSTGMEFYTVGNGQLFDTGPTRPSKLVSAVGRLVGPAGAGANNYDIELLVVRSWDDWLSIKVKNLTTYPSVAFFDNDWPTGQVYFWPIPPANQWELFISWLSPLMSGQVLAATDTYSMPTEYEDAVVLELALRLRVYYRIPTFAGDVLVQRAADARNVIKQSNFNLAESRMPAGLLRGGRFNIGTGGF